MASKLKSVGLFPVAVAASFLALKLPIPTANYPAYLGTTLCRLEHQNDGSTHPHRNILATRNTDFGFQISLRKIDIETMARDRGPIFEPNGDVIIECEDKHGLCCEDIPPPGRDPSAAFGKKVTFTHTVYKKGRPPKEKKSPITITLRNHQKGFSFFRRIPFAKGIDGMKFEGRRRIVLPEDRKRAYDVILTGVEE